MDYGNSASKYRQKYAKRKTERKKNSWNNVKRNFCECVCVYVQYIKLLMIYLMKYLKYVRMETYVYKITMVYSGLDIHTTNC